MLKAKVGKLWSNVRSIFSRGQNQEGTVLSSIEKYHDNNNCIPNLEMNKL